MKTFAMSLAAAVFVGSSAAVGTARAADFGPCPGGFCETSPAMCLDGACDMASVPATTRQWPHTATPQVMPTSYQGMPQRLPAVSQPQPQVARPQAPCPGGVCPPTSYGPHTVGYRPQTVPSHCTTGACPTPVSRQPVYQAPAPRFNFLGLRF